MDRLPGVKEKARYKRFDSVAALAVLGCAVMFLFEAFFVFELYDRVDWDGLDFAPVVRTEAGR